MTDDMIEEQGDEVIQEETKPKRKKKSGPLEQFDNLIKDKLGSSRRVALFTHASPDPDAIGSMMLMEWMLGKQYGLTADSFWAGVIDHPQNMALVNLLDPNMIPISEFDPKEYDLSILLDTVPSHAGIDGHKVEFDIVIDHHKDTPNGGFNGLYINMKAGSAVGTVYALVEHLGIQFDENEADARVATAVMAGIATDTEGMMSEDTSDLESRAWSFCLPHRDGTTLKKIVEFERPMEWIKAQADAIPRAVIDEGIGIVSLRTDSGMIPAKHRAMIPDMADQMVKWEGVTTAIVFGILDGTRLEGCVRSLNASTSVPNLCRELGEKKGGSGGGKLGKGAYKYELGGGSIDEDDEEEDRLAALEIRCTSEAKRIRRLVKK